MSKGYCAVCGMGTESTIGITYGGKTVVLCGGHDLNDLRAMAEPTEPQLIDLIDFCFKKLYGQSVTEQIIRNFIRGYSQREGIKDEG